MNHKVKKFFQNKQMCLQNMPFSNHQDNTNAQPEQLSWQAHHCCVKKQNGTFESIFATY